MSAWCTIVLAGLLGPLQDEKEEYKPGEYRINVYKGVFNAEPNSLSDVVRKAVKGEKVNVTDFPWNGKQRWAKCELADKKTGYISAKAVITQEKFKEQAEGSEEEGSAKAEGYKGSRFDPKTEDEYKKSKNLGPAYDKVDEVCGRPEVRNEKGEVVKSYLPGKPGWKNDRSMMLMQLKAFRREGKLGEFGGG